jgi:hypothetical protein
MAQLSIATHYRAPYAAGGRHIDARRASGALNGNQRGLADITVPDKLIFVTYD